MQNPIVFVLFSISVVLLPVTIIVLFELYIKDQVILLTQEVIEIVSKSGFNFT